MGKVEIDNEFCKGCTLCVSTCPQKLIHVSQRISQKGYHPAEFVDPSGKCTGCALCALMCPDCAIVVYRGRKGVTD